jgi:hypothetical protein
MEGVCAETRQEKGRDVTGLSAARFRSQRTSKNRGETMLSLFLNMRFSAALMAVFFLATRGWTAEPNRIAPPSQPAHDLVQAALEKELAGDNATRSTLLRQAVEESPDNPAAHWQCGEVRVQGKWQSIDEAEKAAHFDKRLADYERRRNAADTTAADQTALARWCRQNKLDDQQRAHWEMVLQVQPDSSEAVRALGLRPYNGVMMTAAEIDRQRSRLRRIAEATDRWRPQVAAWLRALDESDSLIPSDIRGQVLKIADPCEMLGLERALWLLTGADSNRKPDYRRMTLAVTLTLSENPSPAASEGLVRAALFAESENARVKAVDALKGRPFDQCVPLLLSGLQSPLKVEMYTAVTPYGDLVTRHSVSEECELCVFSASKLIVPMHLEDACPWLTKTYWTAPYRMARQIDARRSEAAVDALNDSAAIRAAVEKINHPIAERNRRIAEVLRQVTGRDLGSQPSKWWDWWSRDFNESHDDLPSTKPVYSISERRVENWLYKNCGVSCFAPGTKVWTLSGKRMIEIVKPGDCVLAQDVESGELAYKPVLATTVRKPRPRIRVGLGSESITATPSHPFWVLGTGWRLAKELAVGDRLHTPSGAVTIERLEKLPPEPAPAGLSYNLVVADFNSYFVGEGGLLVHDNAHRAPTAALVPGLVKR